MSAQKDLHLQSMLLDTSKVLESFDNYSTKEEILSDLHKHLIKLESENKNLISEAAKATQRSMRIVNAHLEEYLAKLNQDNCELRQQYREIVQSKNLRRTDNLRRSAKFDRGDSNDRIAEEFYEFIGRESLASNKSPLKFNPRATMPRIGEHNRRESFRTTRNNCKGEMMSSMKRPFVSGKCSLNNSFYLKKEQPAVNSQNVFLNMMNLILEEEKMIEHSLFTQCEQFPQSIIQENVLDVDNLQKMLKQSYSRIQAILQAIEVYKENVSKVSSQVDGIETLIKEFVQAKNKLSDIATKVRRLPFYKQAVAEASSSTTRPRKHLKAGDMQSIKMFLSLFAEDSEGEPILARIKKIESDKLLVDKRQSKIKQLIDSIRQGRHKFEQICEIYSQRIELLQSKIQQHQLL